MRLLGAKCKHLAPLRQAFNLYADSEEEFIYGAYYVTGKGVERFGKQMVLLRREFLDAAQKACFLKADSLLHYVDPPTNAHSEANVRGVELATDVANCRSVTWLLCLKKSGDLERLGHEECLETITCEAEFIEAHIADAIGFEAVEKVRIRKLEEEEFVHHANLLGAPDLVKPDDSEPQAKKNAYYYIVFRREFPKKGVMVEKF